MAFPSHFLFLMSFTIFNVYRINSFPEEPYLTLDYYSSSCPSAQSIIRSEMECAVLSDPRNAAKILRLHFHDCFVQVSISACLLQLGHGLKSWLIWIISADTYQIFFVRPTEGYRPCIPGVKSNVSGDILGNISVKIWLIGTQTQDQLRR